MTDRWGLAQVCGSVAAWMSVAGSPRRSPLCRWRKRDRPWADWWGPPVRSIVDQGCGYFLLWCISLLVVVLWCAGNPDLWDRGLVCWRGTFLLWLVYPNLPFAWAQARARITQLSGILFGRQVGSPGEGGSIWHGKTRPGPMLENHVFSSSFFFFFPSTERVPP